MCSSSTARCLSSLLGSGGSHDWGLVGLCVAFGFTPKAVLPSDEIDLLELVRESASTFGYRRSVDGEVTAESGREAEGLLRALETGEVGVNWPEMIGELICPMALAELSARLGSPCVSIDPIDARSADGALLSEERARLRSRTDRNIRRTLPPAAPTMSLTGDSSVFEASVVPGELGAESSLCTV